MHSASATRVSLQNPDEIGTPGQCVADIQLHHNAFIRITEKGVPREFAIEWRKFDVVVMVTRHHTVCCEFIGDPIKNIC